MTELNVDTPALMSLEDMLDTYSVSELRLRIGDDDDDDAAVELLKMDAPLPAHAEPAHPLYGSYLESCVAGIRVRLEGPEPMTHAAHSTLSFALLHWMGHPHDDPEFCNVCGYHAAQAYAAGGRMLSVGYGGDPATVNIPVQYLQFFGTRPAMLATPKCVQAVGGNYLLHLPLLSVIAGQVSQGALIPTPVHTLVARLQYFESTSARMRNK